MIEWEFLKFSVKNCFEELSKLNKEIEYKNLKDEEIKLEVLSFYSRKNRDKLN